MNDIVAYVTGTDYLEQIDQHRRKIDRLESERGTTAQVQKALERDIEKLDRLLEETDQEIGDLESSFSSAEQSQNDLRAYKTPGSDQYGRKN